MNHSPLANVSICTVAVYLTFHCWFQRPDTKHTRQRHCNYNIICRKKILKVLKNAMQYFHATACRTA